MRSLSAGAAGRAQVTSALARRHVPTPVATVVAVARREIPQRELRNNISAVLRDVARGEPVRVTVRGRPVAELVPLPAGRDHLSPDELRRIVREAPLDERFLADVEAAAGATIDEL